MGGVFHSDAIEDYTHYAFNTIDKAADFASWIGNIKHKPTCLIPTSHRVVPLEHFFYTPFDGSQHELTKIVSSKGEFTNYNDIRKNYQKLHITKIINPFLKYLTEHHLVPALFFIFSRKECERWQNQFSALWLPVKRLVK